MYEALAAGRDQNPKIRAYGPDIAAKPWLLPWIRDNFVEGLLDLRCVVSSREFPATHCL